MNSRPSTRLAVLAQAAGADVPERKLRFVDPGQTPLGSPRPLPVGPITVAVESRQIRRALERAAEKHQGRR